MRNRVTRHMVLLLAILLGTLSTASASFEVVVRQDGEQSTPAEKRFDGIWVGPEKTGSVTLIKELRGEVILQGKDRMSTWWARGVINGNTMICRGSGVTDDGQPFVYESSLTFKDGRLGETWKAIFHQGQELQGNDTLKKIELEIGTRR